MSTGAFGEQNVANDVNLFCLGRDALETERRTHDAFVHAAAAGERHVLAMFGDRHVEGARVLECGAHELRAFHRLAVITEGDGAGAGHLGDLGERLPFLPHGNRTVRIHPRKTSGFTLTLHKTNDGLIVGDRLGVGHRADAGETTSGGAVGAGGDGLDIFAARFAQVDMHVDHTGRDNHTAHVDDFSTIGGTDTGAAGLHASVAQQHITHRVHSPRRIDDASAAQQQVLAHAPPFFAASASSGLPPASR